jgi:hypothetical protein
MRPGSDLMGDGTPRAPQSVSMVIYHVEIKTKDGRVVRGVVAKTKEEALKIQKELASTPLVGPGNTVAIREETVSGK